MASPAWCSPTWPRASCCTAAGSWKASAWTTCWNGAGGAARRIARGGDSLFAVHAEGEDGDEDDEQVYHLSRRAFQLNGRPHDLLLVRLLTAELRRQEVQTWKKVIR
jgi:hypothetical protein